MTMRRLLMLSAAVLCAACAGTPGPGDAGYPYNTAGTYTGVFVVDGQPLDGTLQLETESGGSVTGSVRVPMMGIRGDFEGTLVENQLTFEVTYHNPETGCEGVASGTATVGEDGATIEGPMRVSECGEVMSASLRFRR